MNQHILQGKWKELRGGFKKQWGKLTDDDVRRIQGSLDQITGIIQQRYGYTKERAEHEIDHYLDAYQHQIQDYSSRMKSYGDQLSRYGDQIKNYNDEIGTTVRSAMVDASSKIRAKTPLVEEKKTSKGKGVLAIVAGLTLFALVFYLFNQQEKDKFTEQV